MTWDRARRRIVGNRTMGSTSTLSYNRLVNAPFSSAAISIMAGLEWS
jgi:hypothetical protein